MRMDQGQCDTFRMILREYGYKATDFEVRVADDPAPLGLPLPGLHQGNATVTVTRLTNNCSRNYRDVSGKLYWLVLFEEEACRRKFG
jgi:hypothetical protein